MTSGTYSSNFEPTFGVHNYYCYIFLVFFYFSILVEVIPCPVCLEHSNYKHYLRIILLGLLLYYYNDDNIIRV